MIQVGDRVPSVDFLILGQHGVESLASEHLFSNQTVVLFAVPGAFTPTCHRYHLPGYLDHLDSFKAKGVDRLAVVSVNDPFVMAAWARHTGGAGKILFLANSQGEFTKAVGMDFDGRDAGLGVRSQRYAMIVKDGMVRMLNAEDVPHQVSMSGAAAVLAAL